MPSIANKVPGCLEKLLYPRVLCGAKPRSHPRNSLNVVLTIDSRVSLYSLWYYMRFVLITLLTLCCTCMDQPTQKHVPCLLTNLHMLVQRSLRCAHEAYTIPSIHVCILLIACVHVFKYYMCILHVGTIPTQTVY